MAQWVKNPALLLLQLWCCCGTGSAPSLGTSTSLEAAKKKKKKSLVGRDWGVGMNIWSTEAFYSICYCSDGGTFVQSHKMYETKGEP